MATKLPKISEPAAGVAAPSAKPVVTEAAKPAEPVAKAPPAAAAEKAAKAVEAIAKPVVEAAKAPVAAVKEVAKVATAKTAPVRKAIVKAAKPVAAPKPVIEKAASAVVTAARSVATPASKEKTIMATMFETPKLFTDLNDRTKTAVEKGQKFAAEFGDFNKGNIEAIVESSKIAAKGLETMSQDVVDYTRKSFEGMTTTLKSLSSVKSPTDFFKLQSDYARSAFDAAVAQGSKNTEAMIKLTSDAVQPISSRFAVAVEKVKAAA